MFIVAAEKDKAKFQQEVYELLSQMEASNKERLMSAKQVERLEVTIHDLSIRIEELNRTIVDITSHKTRLSQENIELTKEVQDLKVNIENVSYLRSQVIGQLEDARRRLEDEDRRRSTLESTLHQVEMELESVRVQLEEESEARLDLERQLVRANGEAQSFKSKYESEASARIEEVEEIKRKYTIRIQECEEHIETLVVKVNALEKQKSRLQSEIEILIIDLEKANGTARELQKRCEHLEKLTIEMKSKLEETTTLYETTLRDYRNKQAELQRTTHELEKTRDQKESLLRENKKINDDLHETRNALSEMNRRYHELELECRRLENEREELTAAYKEAEAGRKAEEQRSLRLTAEFNQFRHEAEKRIHEKDEEIESIRAVLALLTTNNTEATNLACSRLVDSGIEAENMKLYDLCCSKQMSIEIEQLNSRVVEAETRLKTEVTRIKKKLQIQITELEMSLDVANKTNIDLQKTCKKQSLQLTEIQTQYDECHRQLQMTVDQYNVAQRKLQSLTGELEEVRGNYEQALRAKRSVEQTLEDASTRISELTTINVNLSASRSKMEQELGTLAADYDEVTKELRVADERFQRVQVELKHSIETLHDEQERVVKIESIKKSLEIEVKNLSVRLEEVETNAIVGGKRIISKLEARIRDIELELDEEKRRHAESIKILRKKERQVKEVMVQIEEDQKTIALLQECNDKANSKISIYKRQVQETEGMSQQSVTRVRRFQRELEAAEDRAETAESNLSMIRAKHRTFVTTSSVPGSQVYLVQETVRSSSADYN
ncbi:hypothetical protein B566_EDAN004095 [Ephemera danica]|nr:hypothetical protein B566_EDAN004095 [Ephemera danica]